MPVVHALVGEVHLTDAQSRTTIDNLQRRRRCMAGTSKSANILTIPASREIKVSSAHQINCYFLRTTSAKH